MSLSKTLYPLLSTGSPRKTHPSMTEKNVNWVKNQIKQNFCILMYFPIHIDTISMGLPIVYFNGSQVEFSNV